MDEEMEEKRYLKFINKRIQKYKIPCEQTQHGNPLDGYDFDCGYPNAPETCDDCICTGGYINPETGKRPYRRKDRL